MHLWLWKAFNYVNHVKCAQKNEKSRTSHCFIRNLYIGQHVVVQTEYGETDWLQIGKGE